MVFLFSRFGGYAVAISSRWGADRICTSCSFPVGGVHPAGLLVRVLITSFPSVQSTSVSLSTSGPLVPPLPTGVTSAVSAPMSGNFLCPAPPWGVSGLLVGVRNLHSRLPVLSSVVYVGEGLLPIPSNLLNVSSGGSSSTWACSCRSLGPPSGGGGEA